MIVVVRHKRRIFASMRYTIHSSSPPTSQRQRNLCITEPKIPTSSTIQCHNCFPEHNASGLMCVCVLVCIWFHAEFTANTKHSIWRVQRRDLATMCCAGNEIDSKLCASYTDTDEARLGRSYLGGGLFRSTSSENLFLLFTVLCTSLEFNEHYVCARSPSFVSVCLAFLAFSDVVVGADAAVASFKDKMFHAIFDPIRIDFVCELTLLKVCIYCRLLEQNPKWEQKKLSRVLRSLSFVRL